MTIPDITHDFEDWVDNLEPVVLTLRPTGTGIFAPIYNITHAHSTQRTFSEISPDGGDIVRTEITWRFPVSESATVIPLGSTITDSSGTVYTIIRINKQVWRSAWSVTTVNLSVENRLDTTVEIQQAIYTKDSSGELLPTWTTLCTRLAKFQPETLTPKFQYDAEMIRVEGTLTLAADFPYIPGTSYRIIDSAGYIYRVLSYTQPSRIDTLPSLKVARFDIPTSSSSGSSSGSSSSSSGS